MTMKSLGWALAITLLAITGAAAEEEPGAIGSYKGRVANVIDAWARNMTQRQNALNAAVKDWSMARSDLVATIEARHHLERERERLEKEKRDLEKKLSELQKSNETRPGIATNRRADAATVNQIKEEIRKKVEEINLRTAEMKKVEERKEHIEQGLSAKTQSIADAVAQIALIKPVIERVATITSPAIDAQTLLKDASGQYRVEWGPELQRWIMAQIGERAQTWRDAPVVVTVVWPQRRFEDHLGPDVVANIKLPDLGD